MRYKLVMLCMLLGTGAATTATAQVNVSIGINLSSYPQMARVPGYPVYYASGLHSNLFFYDGMFWIYQGDNWYASSWYNGPWELVSPYFVPLYILRVPVRYYRAPPQYFDYWSRNAAPRWNEHWGNQWAQRRNGWDRWNRNAAPAPAPLPTYQRQYSGNRYPRVEQQQQLQSQNYRYRPRDAIVQQRVQEQPRAPAASRPGRTDAQDMRQSRELVAPSSTRMHDGPGEMRGRPGQSRDDYSQRFEPPRQTGPGYAEQRQQQPPREQQMRPQPQAQQQLQAQPRSQEHQAPPQREQGMRGQENRPDQAEHRRGPGRERDDDGERGPRRERGNN
jgi:hypothetical protein